MNPITRAAYLSELEKIAATVKQISEGAKRMKGVVRLDGLHMLKDMVTQPKRTFSALQAATVMGGGKGLNPAGALPTRGQLRRIARVTGEDLSGNPGSKAPGTIYSAGPKHTAEAFGAKTKDGKKATHAVTLMHEQYERGVKPRDVNLPYAQARGHISPGVIVKEHNLLSRLKGPGADEARGLWRGIRKSRGEDADIKDGFANIFGPRSAQFLAEGEKVPKAMRKKYLRKIRPGKGDIPEVPAKDATPAQGSIGSTLGSMERSARTTSRKDRLRAALKKHRNSEK
jgi:hypothetical protein